MAKDTLLREIRATHARIAAAAELDDDALLGPAPGMDGWTRKDVLAHVEWWTDHSADVIEGVRCGVDPYPGGDEPWDPDAQNARILAENRDRTAADVAPRRGRVVRPAGRRRRGRDRRRAVHAGPAPVAGRDRGRDVSRLDDHSRARPAPRDSAPWPATLASSGRRTPAVRADATRRSHPGDGVS